MNWENSRFSGEESSALDIPLMHIPGIKHSLFLMALHHCCTDSSSQNTAGVSEARNFFFFFFFFLGAFLGCNIFTPTFSTHCPHILLNTKHNIKKKKKKKTFRLKTFGSHPAFNMKGSNTVYLPQSTHRPPCAFKKHCLMLCFTVSCYL